MKKIFTPEEYGVERRPDMADFMQYGAAAAAALIEQARIERELASFGAELGIDFVEKAQFEDAEAPDEYTLKGRWHTDLEEIADVRGAVPEVNIPGVYTFEEFDRAPHFPVVAKPHMLYGTPWHTSQGEGKFLIENEEQWVRFRAFLVDQSLPFPIGSKWEGYQAVPNTQNLGKNAFYFQDFVETPSDRYTSVRVVVTATGHILCSSLLYSDTKMGEEPTLQIDSENYWIGPGNEMTDALKLPNSPVYLGSKAIFSNRSMGGGGIVLNPDSHSKEASPTEMDILRAHGFDPDEPQLPEELARLSTLIAQRFGKKKGIVLGIDWVLGKDGTWRYLETNVSPGMKTYLDTHMGGSGSETDAYLEVYKTALQDIAEN